MEILLNLKFIEQRQSAQAKLRNTQWFDLGQQEAAELPQSRTISSSKARSPLLELLRRFGEKHPIAALALLLVGGTAHSLDFKGVQLGSVPDAVQREMALGLYADPHLQLAPCHPTPGAPYACRGDTRVADLPVSTWVSFDSAGRVEQIVLNFQPAFFEQIERLALAKYGQPTRSGHQRMANAFGLAVEVVEHDWIEQLTGDSAALLNYSAELDNGQLTLRSGHALTVQR